MAAMMLAASALFAIADGTSPDRRELPGELPPSAGLETFAPLQHRLLFMLDPAPPIVGPSALTNEIERARLMKLSETEDEEFLAPPLVVARISSLPPTSGDSAEQGAARAERTLLRERARSADRMFRHGELTNAIALMLDTERLMSSPELKATVLNRLAAYYFRTQQYRETAYYARKAWEMAPGDAISACNLAATLLTIGEVDEALHILLSIYRQSFDRPQLAYSVHFNLACAYALKNDQQRSLQNLMLAAQIDPAATYATLGDPHLDNVRKNVEFQRLSEVLSSLVAGPAARAGSP